MLLLLLLLMLGCAPARLRRTRRLTRPKADGPGSCFFSPGPEGFGRGLPWRALIEFNSWCRCASWPTRASNLR